MDIIIPMDKRYGYTVIFELRGAKVALASIPF